VYRSNSYHITLLTRSKNRNVLSPHRKWARQDATPQQNRAWTVVDTFTWLLGNPLL